MALGAMDTGRSRPRGRRLWLRPAPHGSGAAPADASPPAERGFCERHARALRGTGVSAGDTGAKSVRRRHDPAPAAVAGGTAVAGIRPSPAGLALRAEPAGAP